MPRRIQDIVVSDRRGIRDIPVPQRAIQKESVRSKKNPSDEKEENDLPINRVVTPSRKIPFTPPVSPKKPRKKIGKWPLVTLGVVVCIAIAGFLASTYYSRASFTITPKVIPVSVNSTYVAQGNQQEKSLFYEVVTLKGGATTTVAAKNGPQTNTKATGKVVLYNAFSNQAVRLVAGTRLSGEDGLIYRLTSSVAIPGYTKSSTGVVPGKITTSIVADQAGQNYNISSSQPTDMKIVAYKGSSKYESIYARTTGAIAGGFVGVKKIISQSVLASSTEELKSQITASLEKEIKDSVPNGYVIYDKAYKITFGSPIIGGTNEATGTVSLQGTIYGIAFPKDRLIEVLAGEQTISLFGPFSYSAPGLELLNVTITNLKDFSPIKKGAVVVRVKGDMNIIGTIPVEEIKQKLAGIPLASTQDVFKAYDSVIESSSGELVPPWSKIPTNLERIKVVVQEP